MFTNLSDMVKYNGALIEKDAYDCTRRMVDYLVFYCQVQDLEVRPLMVREHKGHLEIIWSGVPPEKLGSQCPGLQVVIDGQPCDYWTVDSESILDYLQNIGGTAQAGN